MTAPAAASISDAAVAIFVEDSNGRRIATGNGLLLSYNGTIATDMQPILAWLQSDENTLIVRAGNSGYYPLDTLLFIDREKGIAIFRINSQGLKTAGLAPDYEPARGDKVLVVGNQEGLKSVTVEGSIREIRSDGLLELTFPVRDLRGAPVKNENGEVVAIATFNDGLDLAVPVSVLLSLLEQHREETPETESSNTELIKKARAAISRPRAGADDYFRLGVAYKKAGMGEKAIEAFEKAIELKPVLAEAYHGLGVSYAGEGRYEDAVKALMKAVNIRPDYAEAHGNLGFLFDHLGRHDEAVASFKEALRLRPDYAEAYNGLGVSLAREKNYEEAIEIFRQAIRIRPELKKARFNLALSYISLGDVDSARRQEALLRDIDPELADRLLDFLETDTDLDETEAEEGDYGDDPYGEASENESPGH